MVDGIIVQPDAAPTPIERVRQALAELQAPISVKQLRKLCGIRTEAVCSALAKLSDQTREKFFGTPRAINSSRRFPFPALQTLRETETGNMFLAPVAHEKHRNGDTIHTFRSLLWVPGGGCGARGPGDSQRRVQDKAGKGRASHGSAKCS